MTPAHPCSPPQGATSSSSPSHSSWRTPGSRRSPLMALPCLNGGAARTHTHTHKHTRESTHTNKHTCGGKHTHRHTHTQTHTHTHTYTWDGQKGLVASPEFSVPPFEGEEGDVWGGTVHVGAPTGFCCQPGMWGARKRYMGEKSVSCCWCEWWFRDQIVNVSWVLWEFCGSMEWQWMKCFREGTFIVNCIGLLMLMLKLS